MKAQRTTTWKTTDGHLHEVKRTAARHQAWLDLRDTIAAAVVVSDKDPQCEHIGLAVAIAEELLANRPELLRLLRTAEPADGDGGSDAS